MNRVEGRDSDRGRNHGGAEKLLKLENTLESFQKLGQMCDVESAATARLA